MIIKHRVNSIEELLRVPEEFGLEIDLRVHHDSLVLAHDPFTAGDKFEDWLPHFRHKMLILNVKEDGLEETILKLLVRYKIMDYFFLDQPFPTLRKSAMNDYRTALRLSEYENPVNNVDLKVEWLWLDSFFGDWQYLEQHADWIKQGQFRTCVVSPELQGRVVGDEPEQLVKIMQNLGLEISAVCTKRPEAWEGLLK
jgi:hypothetical protein